MNKKERVTVDNSVEYDLNDYKELIDKKYEFKQSLNHLENKIENVKDHIYTQIEEICEGVINYINFERTQIIVYAWSISFVSLQNLQKEMHLKDIIIKTDDNGFKLYLVW